MDKDAIGTDTCLTRVEEFDHRRAFCRMNRIGVVKHDEGSMTAQFHRQPFELGGGILG